MCMDKNLHQTKTKLEIQNEIVQKKKKKSDLCGWVSHLYFGEGYGEDDPEIIKIIQESEELDKEIQTLNEELKNMENNVLNKSYMTEIDLEKMWDDFNPSETQRVINETVRNNNPYVSISNMELLVRLSQYGKELDRLVVEMNEVSITDPYDVDFNPEERSMRDVDLDINYTLWETNRVVKELCSRYKVNVE